MEKTVTLGNQKAAGKEKTEYEMDRPPERSRGPIRAPAGRTLRTALIHGQREPQLAQRTWRVQIRSSRFG